MYSNWLLGYSSLLGPIAGIMVVDYFADQRVRKYDLLALYQDDAGYPAWNKAGFIAFPDSSWSNADRNYDRSS